MAMIQEVGYSIKRGKEEAYQKWIEENDELIRKGVPDGVEYLGTYLVAFSTEKRTGEYRTLWRLQSYASFDVLEEATRDPNSEWGRVQREVTKFLDAPIGGEFSSVILRPLIGAVLWDIN
jgi:hypothetical protein